MGANSEQFIADREAQINEQNIEYRLRLKEDKFNELHPESKSFLMSLGMEVKQLPTKADEIDEHYKSLRKKRIDSWNDEQEYLFKKRHNILK